MRRHFLGRLNFLIAGFPNQYPLVTIASAPSCNFFSSIHTCKRLTLYHLEAMYSKVMLQHITGESMGISLPMCEIDPLERSRGLKIVK